MTKTTIDFTSLIPVGKVASNISNDILHMTTTRSIHDVGYNIRHDKITSYMQLPGQYRLPLRIDMSICIDTPEMLLLMGDGHISFASPWMENRRIEDIANPSGKPKLYDNSMCFNRFTDISIIFNLKGMQILIDNKERYFSTRERYMKSDYFVEQNSSGFHIGITCTKRADLLIRSINITEFEKDYPFRPHTIKEETPRQDIVTKPTFNTCIQGLPMEIKEEIIKTEQHLKSLNNLKFKRTIEKHGNKITYVESKRGISYAIYLSGCVMHHSFQWYFITNGKPETWHRKANSLEAVLDEIQKDNPDLADRIFYNLNECIGCNSHCLAKTPYYYKSQKKITCHGRVFLKMYIPDFEDVRDFFSVLNSMVGK